MNKQDLANNLASEAGITKALAKECVDIMIAELAKGIVADERTYLPGLGIFTKVHKNERKGRNPKTGAEVMIPAKTSVKFKSSIVVE